MGSGLVQRIVDAADGFDLKNDYPEVEQALQEARAEIERLRALNERLAIGLQDIGNLAGKGGIVNGVADPIGHLRAIHETADALTAARQEPS